MKLNIYKAAVMSLMTYGNEVWSLNPDSMAKINAANARCLSRITGKSAHQEASARTQTYNIISQSPKEKEIQMVGAHPQDARKPFSTKSSKSVI